MIFLHYIDFFQFLRYNTCKKGGIDMDLAQAIGNNIRTLMESRSVTIVELAKALSISRQTLQNYLKGNSTIDSVKLVEIADYFSVSINDLLVNSHKGSNFLFRTVLNYQLATDTISDKVMMAIESYYDLAKKLGTQVSYFPEQYNLIVSVNNSPIDINFEWTDYFSSKLKMTEDLLLELQNIANEQRKNLGIHDTNALAAISLLQKKGINIFFVDFGNSQTSGLSYVDDEKGCFIFVNCNAKITLERMIFTVFHEYGHIVLHRPLYKRKLSNVEDKKLNFLDKMANAFAGYFLVPYEQLSTYNNILNNFNSLSQLLPIKQHFQVSLQTLIISMSNYGYVNKVFVSKFFDYLRTNHAMELEPEPLIAIPEIKQSFLSIKNAKLFDFLRNGYFENFVDTTIVEKILWVDDITAKKTLKKFELYQKIPNLFDLFSTQ